MVEATRREILAGLGASATGATAPPHAQPEPPLVLDDASRLNRTRVAAHWIAQPDPEKTFLARLRAELKEAAAAGRPVALGAARHSMGGHSLATGGTAITLDRGVCEPDRAAAAIRIRGGARWRDVLRVVDPLGLSPTVMQSNHDFGVAASFSVNGHGWPVPHGPLASTVGRIELMLADGTIVGCSRSENAELFRLAAGGYGLFGVIVSLELEATENLALGARFELMPAARLGARFAETVAGDPTVRMAFGRVSVSRELFFSEAEFVTLRPVPVPRSGLPPLADEGSLFALAAWLYRAQIGSDSFKRLRWQAETAAAPRLWPKLVTRNRLLNTPVSALAGTERNRTDILHEYFVPPARFAEFCLACRELIPPSGQELLNVTLRYLGPDRDSVLVYAPEPRIGAVMAFSQEITPGAEIVMQRLTEALTDRILELGGSYYLPYRLHARPDQFERAYPMVERIREAKRRYDPNRLFRNGFSERYRIE